MQFPQRYARLHKELSLLIQQPLDYIKLIKPATLAELDDWVSHGESSFLVGQSAPSAILSKI
jgi:hypothetical protein